MDIALAADRGRIPQLLRGRAHGRRHMRDAHALLAPHAPAQPARHVHASIPGAEVLGADLVVAGDFLQVFVHVGRADRLHLARVVHVLEELLPRQVADAPDHAREPGIVDGDAVELAALAAELELDARAVHLHVPVAHRREAEGVVLLGVALVADADAGALEQPNDERQHLAARQSLQRHVGAHLAAHARQHARELGKMVELVGVAHFTPARVVAVLLSSARIAAGCLQVAAFIAADPDIGPRRRDRERLDPLERVPGRQFLALRVEVFESVAGVSARVALLAIAGIAQPPGGCGTLAAA